MASITETLSEAVTSGRIIGALCALVATLFIVDIATRPSYPDSLPRVGYGKGFVASIKNYLLSYYRHKSWVLEGYEKYSKCNQAFVLPSGLGRRSAVVLPRSQTKWFLEQPDNLISADEANNDSLYSKYNFLGKRDPQDPFNNRTIHRGLLRALSDLIPGMQEEVQDTIDRVFGLGTEEWKSINIWDTWLSIIPQITNRMVLGKDLGRNPDLLKNMVGFTESVLRNVFIFDFLSKSFHPFLGPLLTIPNWIYYLRGSKLTLPVIKKRLEDMEKKSSDPAYENWKEPEDFITWVIRQARSEGNTMELEPSAIAKRTLLVEVASIHTTAMTAQNTLLDLISSDPSCLEALREEADRVFREEGNKWNKAGLSRLYRIDSAIRESQRHSNFAVTLLDHKVIAREGITNKDQGWHLPYGSTLTLNLHGVYHDPDLHDNPETYDALRYSRPVEEHEARREEEKDPSEGQRLKRMGMVTTSEEHLVFGHGRHAW
ncbi:MAG: hypothetical protein M1839_009389 [Geoglossum umbratile]|nr:MAG: hypothetical protein M1839_009389 [Geoglossum umbratile]